MIVARLHASDAQSPSSSRENHEPQVSGARGEAASARLAAGTAFYRKYTEQLLRRYARTSLAVGRSPSVLGNVIFRGRASHSVVRNLEDAVIFVHDVESCLKRLDRGGRELVLKIAIQEYTQGEVAEMTGSSVRSVMRRYGAALDRLTDILLDVDLLEVAEGQVW